MPVFEDAVRPYQLPATASPTAELNLFNLVSQAPVIVIAGQSGGIGTLPQLQTGRRVWTETTSYYEPQKADEKVANEQ
jgi:hypothetical protein